MRVHVPPGRIQRVGQLFKASLPMRLEIEKCGVYLVHLQRREPNRQFFGRSIIENELVEETPSDGPRTPVGRTVMSMIALPLPVGLSTSTEETCGSATPLASLPVPWKKLTAFWIMRYR